MSQYVNFPLRISYPADRPYAGLQIEKAGDRVIITYANVAELRECLRLHKLAQVIEREVKPGNVVKIDIKQEELI